MIPNKSILSLASLALLRCQAANLESTICLPCLYKGMVGSSERRAMSEARHKTTSILYAFFVKEFFGFLWVKENGSNSDYTWLITKPGKLCVVFYILRYIVCKTYIYYHRLYILSRQPTSLPADSMKVGNMCLTITYHYGWDDRMSVRHVVHVYSPEQDLKLLIFNILYCNVAFGGSKPAWEIQRTIKSILNHELYNT